MDKRAENTANPNRAVAPFHGHGLNSPDNMSMRLSSSIIIFNCAFINAD